LCLEDDKLYYRVVILYGVSPFKNLGEQLVEKARELKLRGYAGKKETKIIKIRFDGTKAQLAAFHAILNDLFDRDEFVFLQTDFEGELIDGHVYGGFYSLLSSWFVIYNGFL
jgi:hypothetical protein